MRQNYGRGRSRVARGLRDVWLTYRSGLRFSWLLDRSFHDYGSFLRLHAEYKNIYRNRLSNVLKGF